MPSRPTPEHWTGGVTCESFRSHRHSIFAALLPSFLRRPICLWVCYLGVVTVVAVIAKMIWPSVQPGPSGVSVLQVCLQILITLLVLPFAAALGWRNLGLTWRPTRSQAPVLAFPVLTIVIGYLAGFKPMPTQFVLLAAASVILAGVSEELAFRGVFLKLFSQRGMWQGVLVSSAFFGLLHASNLALGASLQGTALQICFSAMAGLGYAALRLRTGSIWPCILLHAAYDLTFRIGNLEPGSGLQYTVYMLHGVGWAMYAIFVLRPTKVRLVSTQVQEDSTIDRPS